MRLEIKASNKTKILSVGIKYSVFDLILTSITMPDPQTIAICVTYRACERSGKISRSSLSSIYGSPAHRSIPAPMTSRSCSAHAPLNFWNPAHRSVPLIWLFGPLPSRSAARPDLRGGEARAPNLFTNRGPPTTPAELFYLFFADRYLSDF